MLAIVARSGSDSESRPAPKNSTNLSTTPCARSRWVTVNVRSVAVAPGARRPVRRTPTTCGNTSTSGWPSIAASASIPPTPQPRTPRPLTIVVWESVPTSVSGKARVPAAGGRCCTNLPPAEKSIALLVALELEIGVATQRLARGEEVDLQRVIDDQVDREARVDPARIAP